jgi:molecular chaperone GrpE
MNYEDLYEDNTEENETPAAEAGAAAPTGAPGGENRRRSMTPKAMRRRLKLLSRELAEKESRLSELEESLKELAALKEKLAAAEAKVGELEEQKKYDLAEAENYKKRVIRERGELLRYNGEKVLKDLLEVADNFERALEHAEGASKESLLEGLVMIKNGLLKVLEKNEVKMMECLGEKFDPNVHEALTMCPDPGKEDGTVMAVQQQGYFFKDHLLRPAKVVVVKNPPKEEAAEQKEVNANE